MIKVIHTKNPAGNYWLDYTKDDEVIVEHLLSGSSWEPTKEFAASFIILAKMHGVSVPLVSA